MTEALFHLFKHVWSSKTIPDGWKNTNIVQIYKGKHSRQDLSSYRNIHTKLDEFFKDSNEYKCECGDFDTEALTCRLYKNLREGPDLVGPDIDFVKYYKLVISERQKEDT